MKDRSLVLYRTVLAVMMAGFFAAPAQAGFEWTPPPAAPAIVSPALGEAGPQVPAVPPGAVDATELMPVPGASNTTPDAVIEPVESLPPPVISQAPMIEKESTALAESTMAETLEAPKKTGPLTQVVGFGSDIPLALAMGQIVPAEFAYSFASNINMGLKISWNGGKPWDEVLNDALAPHKMRADIVGTAVIVRADLDVADMRPVTNPMAYEADLPSSAESVTAPDVTPAVATSAADEIRGEGTANYPRRTPPQKGFLGNIFTPDDEKGRQAPRPPEMGNQGIQIENEVSPEKMTTAEPVAKEAASFEPAAPASLAPIPTASTMPVISQKISYADESLADNTSILPDRASSKSAAIEPRGPILDPFSVKFWQADNNQSLREVLIGWAEEAGVEVIWDSGYDYKLPKAISLHGTFPEAVTKVFELYGVTEPRPQGRLHPNLPKGPSVLLVENYP